MSCVDKIQLLVDGNVMCYRCVDQFTENKMPG